MGYAKCEVCGYIVNVSDGQTKTGKRYFRIRLVTGKSEKLKDGTYDNKNQAWWDLTAWGDYASKLRFEGLQKGDKIRASIQDPVPHVYATAQGEKIGCTICATLWNHTLSKVIWFPKGESDADDFHPQDDATLPPGADDFDPAAYENMMGQYI